MSEKEDERLFEKLGGVDGVEVVARAMYDRVLADPELRDYFERANVERLRRMQFQIVAAALGGPVVYSNEELGKAHGKLGVTGSAFAKFCGHLADVLEERGLDVSEVNDVMARLSVYKDPITGQMNVDG